MNFKRSSHRKSKTKKQKSFKCPPIKNPNSNKNKQLLKT